MPALVWAGCVELAGRVAARTAGGGAAYGGARGAVMGASITDILRTGAS
ncbi:MAG: hypothetical protein JJU24_07470 [Natronohydrobacter sp.]|nr:hypothetical protein [Natronohydrobacter sp.]